jgi:hypothetical protein
MFLWWFLDGSLVVLWWFSGGSLMVCRCFMMVPWRFYNGPSMVSWRPLKIANGSWCLKVPWWFLGLLWWFHDVSWSFVGSCKLFLVWRCFKKKSWTFLKTRSKIFKVFSTQLFPFNKKNQNKFPKICEQIAWRKTFPSQATIFLHCFATVTCRSFVFMNHPSKEENEKKSSRIIFNLALKRTATAAKKKLLLIKKLI